MEIILTGSASGSPVNTPTSGGGDVLGARWGEVRVHAKSWWSELTDEDLDEVAGNREQLVRVIERCYGSNRDQAEQEVNKFLIRVERLLGAG